MSVQALNAVRAHRFGSVHRKLLMYVLADYSGADWATYVGQQRLAAETGLGERTVRRLVAAFVSEGLLRRERRYGKALGRRTDALVLVPAAIADLPASMAARSRPTYRPLAPDLPATGARPTGQPVQDLPATGATIHARTSADSGRVTVLEPDVNHRAHARGGATAGSDRPNAGPAPLASDGGPAPWPSGPMDRAAAVAGGLVGEWAAEKAAKEVPA